MWGKILSKDNVQKSLDTLSVIEKRIMLELENSNDVSLFNGSLVKALRQYLLNSRYFGYLTSALKILLQDIGLYL
jgi:hypothetical protein